jgi:hypothetical protein
VWSGVHAAEEGGSVSEQPYIERCGRNWQVVFPAIEGEGMDTCTGPHLTKLGARLSLWFETRHRQQQ